MTHGRRTLAAGGLSRVEGEGGLRVVVDGGRVTSTELDIYEPPRFFEALLRGRPAADVPDVTARICGICPVAYQTSACAAIEQACGVRVPDEVTALRRLLYCGEWISSHALHVFLLHLPDYLGHPDAVDLARHRPGVVELGLRLKKVGNTVLEVVGGRAVHPVTPRVGGFHRAPTRAEVRALAAVLEPALDDALAAVRLVGALDVPDVELDHDLLALQHPRRYAVEGGRIRTAGGLDLAPEEFPAHVHEHQVPYSTALHATLDGRLYLTGPLARYSLGSGLLTPAARDAAAAAGLAAACRNPFRSIVVRAVEIVFAVEEALALTRDYRPPDPPAVPVPARPGVGHGVSEAPRGLLYHRYRLAADGTVLDAVIVPPTSQNQAAIEHALHRVVTDHLHLDDAALTALCERTVRCYDPCISCAAHFLDLRVDRR
jgi:coenzyme F420-reducing hydrogenase alpha subunit